MNAVGSDFFRTMGLQIVQGRCQRFGTFQGPCRFFFYSFDCNEPMHVHVERAQSTCQFRLEPLVLANNHGLRHMN